MVEGCVAHLVPHRTCGCTTRGGDGFAFGRSDRSLASLDTARDGFRDEIERRRRNPRSARCALEALNLILIGSAVVPLTILGFVIWYFFRAAGRNDQREAAEALGRGQGDGNSRTEIL
jgi:hypothetical protein